MNKVLSAIAAGFAGTLVMSLLMIIKKVSGVMPDIDPLAMATQMAHQQIGLPDAVWVGWVLHFAIGSVIYAVPFAFVRDLLPGHRVVKGVSYGVILWLGMMLVAMPMAGQGLFGLALGPPAPVMTLVLHLAYGVTTALVFDKLQARTAAPTT
jgi:uncharacterized membrane protein YagU involved in acid resistance